jgi:hypothetical protein
MCTPAVASFSTLDSLRQRLHMNYSNPVEHHPRITITYSFWIPLGSVWINCTINLWPQSSDSLTPPTPHLNFCQLLSPLHCTRNGDLQRTSYFPLFANSYIQKFVTFRNSYFNYEFTMLLLDDQDPLYQPWRRMDLIQIDSTNMDILPTHNLILYLTYLLNHFTVGLVITIITIH